MRSDSLSKLRAAARKDSAIFARVWRAGIIPGTHQYEMAARVDDERILFQADFWPRDHGKSEIFCVAYPLRRVCEDPNIRILIVQKTATEAEKTLQVIKTEIEKNKPLKAFYAAYWHRAVGHRDISNATGQIDRDGRREGTWQRRRIYCKRTRTGKDPTIEAVGVGGAITGGHFDIIILDDIEDDENTRTQDRLATLTHWFTGTVMQLREPHTKMVVVGTLKTAGPDIYNFVLENSMWDTCVKSALVTHRLEDIQYEPVFSDGGTVVDVDVKTRDVETLWPARWDVKALLLDMMASVRSIWIREKLNDLKALAGAIFKRDWFTYFDQVPVRFERIIQCWDTAFEESMSADYSVCISGGLLRGSVYILSVYRERLELPGLVAAIKHQYQCYRPECVYVERRASGRSAVQVIKTETTIPILDVEPGSQDKAARARSVTPYFEGKRVLFPVSAPWLDVLTDELVMFPASAHDDQVDAIVYLLLELMLGAPGIESESPDNFGGYGGDS